MQEVDWIPLFGIQYQVGVDGISLVLVLLTTPLTWISILASFGPIKDRVKEYMISFLVLEVGMLGVFLALDTFLFYIFWEIVLVPMYLIIGIWGGANRIYATIKFVLYTLVGSLLMLVAILALAFTYQSTTGWDGAFDYERSSLRLRPDAAVLGLRRASSWPSRSRCRCGRSTPGCPTRTSRRPRRARSSSPASCSSWAATAHPLRPAALPGRRRRTWRWLVIVLSVIGIVYGAIVAIVQPDLKKLIAYSRSATWAS